MSKLLFEIITILINISNKFLYNKLNDLSNRAFTLQRRTNSEKPARLKTGFKSNSAKNISNQ